MDRESAGDDAAVVLYFGGNAEDVLYTAQRRTSARALVVVNYRGYGGSTGEPGQQALYDDGLAIYDYRHQARRADRSTSS